MQPRNGSGLPDFIVLGAQKSASTFLQDQMDQHPQIEIAPGESRHFEDPDYSNGGVEALPGLFHQQGPGIVRGIKRPDYLGRPEVPERIAAHIPQARLFVVIREPIARAVSSYFHYVRHGFVPLLPLDEAFTALLDGSLTPAYPRSTEILNYGLYGEHIQRYLTHFPRAQLMIFSQDLLIGDPVASLRRAFEFVGVDDDFVTEHRTSVSNRGVYSPTRLRLLRSKNRFLYTYTPTLDRRFPRRPSPPGWLWAATVVTIDRGLLARVDKSKPPALADSIRRRLADYYAPDAQVLAKILLPSEGPVRWLNEPQ
jgi:sulfotransferase family protein